MRATPVMIISSTSGIITATIIGGSQQQLIVGLPLLMPCSAERDLAPQFPVVRRHDPTL